ncbi:hypothetical protein RIF29_41505 [Crotalaria pallida]|uniref:Uncharacterized protein n=1 Tax=Crotalaria pallida TaxID=3830 RepID=A0AAN9E5Q0_CROPI
MAFNSSTYSGSDYGEYNFNSYTLNYDYEQTPPFMSYNGYDYNQPNYVYDDPNLYYAPNYPSQNYQTISYSATNFSDPKSIEYDPNYGMTQLVISYNNLEFNEPAFDEYDPTPYGGGYDMAETYGKPLPPSDKICYPRSGSISSINPPFDSVPVEPIVPLPIVEKETDEKAIIPLNNGNSSQVAEVEEKPREVDEDNNYDDEFETHDEKPNEGDESEDNEENGQHEDDYGSGIGDEYEKQVAPPQCPSGYGLEAMDICESLFGYWPCLSRMKKREQEHCCEEIMANNNRGNNCMHENMWKFSAADYLFGNPDPYSGCGRGEDGNSSSPSIYGGDLIVYGYDYERHYPTQAQYKQIDFSYTDQSW